MKSCEEMYQEVQSLIETDRQEDAIRTLEKLLESYPNLRQPITGYVLCISTVVAKPKHLNTIVSRLILSPSMPPFTKAWQTIITSN